MTKTVNPGARLRANPENDAAQIECYASSAAHDPTAGPQKFSLEKGFYQLAENCRIFCDGCTNSKMVL